MTISSRQLATKPEQAFSILSHPK